MPTKLRLGPLPKQETTKMVVKLPVALVAELEQYAATYRQIYDEQIDTSALVPHMLAWFLRNDRGFRRRNG